MKKLIEGIIDFRKHRLAEYREKYSKLALGQSPDTLFIACSDSRVVPNLFASTNPGDLFVIRNVGNLIPPCNKEGHSGGDISEWAAIEFAVLQLNISDIIVCGHSECAAMQAIVEGRDKAAGDHLKLWLKYGEAASLEIPHLQFSGRPLSPSNQVSQGNVLLQIKHLKTYSLVQERIKQGRLQIHGWWFDIASGNVTLFNETIRRFELIDGPEKNLR